MPGVPNVFANATSNIPLLELDQNFNTLITIGNTSVGLGNTSFTITPNSTAGIVGTTTNDSANAGSFGEYVENNVPPGGGEIPLTSTQPANITSISLTAGDWDVYGTVVFDGAVGTIVSALIAGVSSTSATLPARGSLARNDMGFPSGATPFSGNEINLNIGPSRFTLSSTVTVYLIAEGVFSGSTLSAYGEIRARRIR